MLNEFVIELFRNIVQRHLECLLIWYNKLAAKYLKLIENFSQRTESSIELYALGSLISVRVVNVCMYVYNRYICVCVYKYVYINNHNNHNH